VVKSKILVFTKNLFPKEPDFCGIKKKHKVMYQTTSFLEDLQQQTEALLQQAIREWQMLPPAVLAKQPVPGQWSAAQCLEHLNYYSRYYLPAIEKAIAAGKSTRPSATFQAGWLGAYFTKLMLPQANGALKSKMQAPKNAVPSEAPDPRAVLAEFIDHQETQLKLLDQATSVNIGRVRVPISIAPWIRLKLGDTFAFLIAHEQRHAVQLIRAIEYTKVKV